MKAKLKVLKTCSSSTKKLKKKKKKPISKGVLET